MERILVVAAHPDDELLGSGGTIKKLANEGCEAYCLLLASGVTGRYDKVTDTEEVRQALEQLHKESKAAADIIGFKQIEFCNLPDNRLDELTLLDVIKVIEKKIDEIKPSVIFTHHYGDLNIDHRIVFQAVMTAARPVGDYTVKEIYCFETLSSTEWEFTYNNSFRPNVFFDIESTFKDKADALSCYTMEMRDYPHPRSIEALEAAAKRWGTVVGFRRAEAFELIRKVIR